MKLTSLENSLNYQCQVVKIKEIYNIEGADKIQRVVIQGNDVVTSKDIKVGDLMIYFCSGIKLNEEYCKYNNLYDKSELNRDTTQKGFIGSKQSRVKCIKLKGIVSNGMLMPMSSLNFDHMTKNTELKEGDEFNQINGLTLCEKYFVSCVNNKSSTKEPKQKIKLKNLIVDNQFKFHFETAHFVKNIEKFKLEDTIIITRKFHGSSCINSHCLINKNLKWYEKLLLKLGLNIETKEYGYVWSSGKPKSKTPKGLESNTNSWSTKNQSFYNEDIWKKAHNLVKDKLEKGITIYSELIGKGIQGTEYEYNTNFAIKVYRITQTNVDGITYEFSWNQVKEYCNKYNLEYVTEYFNDKLQNFNTIDNKDTDLLSKLQKEYLNKSYDDCLNDEGVCIRLNNEIFKLKSPNFIKQESDLAEKEVSNIEDEN